MRVVTTDSESDFEAAMACTRNRKISPSTTAICLELARRQNLPLATLDFAWTKPLSPKVRCWPSESKRVARWAPTSLAPTVSFPHQEPQRRFGYGRAISDLTRSFVRSVLLAAEDLI